MRNKQYSIFNTFKYHRGDKYTLIMTGDGIGVCSVCYDENIKTSVCIYNLSVEKKYRRNGYGNILINEAEEEAKRMNARVVTISAEKDSFMVDWYIRKGYVPVFSDNNYITFYKNLDM